MIRLIGSYELHGTGAVFTHVDQQLHRVGPRNAEGACPVVDHSGVIREESPQECRGCLMSMLRKLKRLGERERESEWVGTPRLGVPKHQPSIWPTDRRAR